MTSILQEIVAVKREEVAARKSVRSQSYLCEMIGAFKELPRGFMNVLRQQITQTECAVIAEVKKASPSRGVIAKYFEPLEIATGYVQNGACCLSVLTDERFFQGNDDYLRRIHEAVQVPILRKDFMIDEYQIIESRALEADCVLLIASILDDAQLHDYTRIAHDLGMDVLVEVHNREEFDRALALPIDCIGVNNRNLHDFSVDLNTSIELAAHLPEHLFMISESGISTNQDIIRLKNAGIYAYLVGSALMEHDHPGTELNHLLTGAAP
ncbi:indole-3-glycerol phosphate synthase TrpC [Suttonella sp. R2A3]|uniref:indole-3-glycerol phosphate synthase TrpC n=1 Tax=Suttonella sp. R2A3 TaxID=2908648 RepID=UPI001F27D2FB|nr:indole-3-glycerol phosphate synthase TrpC [Suttonella sp. R2A3]UJF24388.1 indole-3-glycerol phosphate synthase TrpC [Suttonella sp. R2A3]